MATVHHLNPLRLVNLPAPPADPEEGVAYYDTTLRKARIWDGEFWRNLPEGLPVFVQSTQPSPAPYRYIWFRTDMPFGGTDILYESGRAEGIATETGDGLLTESGDRLLVGA